MQSPPCTVQDHLPVLGAMPKIGMVVMRPQFVLGESCCLSHGVSVWGKLFLSLSK